jgi:cyclohexyl-isocyanide hydratase
MRWFFHIVRKEELTWDADGRYAPASLRKEGFIHGSYKEAVLESARLYFGADAHTRGKLAVLAIDPRRLDMPVDIAETPRGPMPHVHGALPRDAVHMLEVDEVEAHADQVTGTRIGFLAFEGMTLLDLVGPLDALSRIASMGFDASASCEVVALTRPADAPTIHGVPVWSAWGAAVAVTRYRPTLDEFDLLVIPGGPGTRALERDSGVASYLATYPKNRLVASVCTGALVLGAAGRLKGRRATTHATSLDALARHGVTVVRERVVDDGQIVTAGGVTSGIDLAIHLVERLMGSDVAQAIARQMEVSRACSRR